MHRLIVSRDADIRDETLQRSPLQCRYRLWLGRGHRRFDSPLASLGQDSARPSQLLHVVMMHGQFVDWGPLFGAVGKGPPLQSFGTGVKDFVDIGTVEVGGKGKVEGEVDHGISRGQRRYGGAVEGAFDGLLGDGEVHGIRPRGHEAGRGHLFQAMTSLAGNVAESLHDAPSYLPSRCRCCWRKADKEASDSDSAAAEI